MAEVAGRGVVTTPVLTHRSTWVQHGAPPRAQRGSDRRHQPYRTGTPLGVPLHRVFDGKLLNVEAFETLLEAKVLAEHFRIGYNTYRPHSSLDWR
jgi:transposase InsO family protein